MIHAVRLYRDTYVDSVVQLSGTRALRAVDGVDWAAAAMATPGNLETLAAEGFPGDDVAGAGANDLVVAVRADSTEAADAAREAGEAALFAARIPGSRNAGSAEPPARTLGQAVDRLPAANVAVVSVPGDYAALEAHKALSAGLDVLLFSDNVSVEAEVELKERAAQLGRLVMGPGAGTAMLGRTCLGFANVVAPGPVAVVAAAGTGAQEVAALLDRWGVGVSHVIGLGGRDLGAAVGGRMARTALAALRADSGTEVVLLVSKPPAPEVAREVLAAAGDMPLVAALVGLDQTAAGFEAPDGVVVTRTLEAGAVAALATVGRPAPDVVADLEDRVAAAGAELPGSRTLVRGLFSGGTLCYESLVVLSDVLGPVYSNTPLEKDLGLPARDGAHMCLDLGEEEYTKGRPHPMIDPAARIELLREVGRDERVAAVVLDVVLGYGAHPDPAAAMVPAIAKAQGAARKKGRALAFIASVCGTDEDPQGLEGQEAALEKAGVLLAGSNAGAARLAAAIAAKLA